MKSKFTIHRSILKVLLVLVIIGIVGVLTFVILVASGKSRLYRKSENKRPDLASAAESFEAEEDVTSPVEEEHKGMRVPPEQQFTNWQEGDVRYKGVHYRYNEDVLTFLFLGIDQEGKVKEAKTGWAGGQSDAIFLLVLDPNTYQASLINVNRDTITDIDMYAPDGTFLKRAPSQITLQHAYGDGKELSCERTVTTVSRMFYDLPIHGYCAINYDAVPKINDAVGGVDLVALETIKKGKNVVFQEGKKVHLKGEQALLYLRSRDCDSFGSASRRAERQKQYLTTYADAAKKAVKKDATVFVTLFNTIRKYMVTDVTVDEVAYFSTQINDYKFDSTRVYSLEGEITIGDDEYEEFHYDEKALYELMLKVFYNVIDD